MARNDERQEPDIPLPGKRLDFESWTRLVVDVVRAHLLDVVARRYGERSVVLRHDKRAATIVENVSDGSRVVSFTAEGGNNTMSSIGDPNRGDAFTARNIGISLVSFFG